MCQESAQLCPAQTRQRPALRRCVPRQCLFGRQGAAWKHSSRPQGWFDLGLESQSKNCSSWMPFGLCTRGRTVMRRSPMASLRVQRTGSGMGTYSRANEVTRDFCRPGVKFSPLSRLLSFLWCNCSVRRQANRLMEQKRCEHLRNAAESDHSNTRPGRGPRSPEGGCGDIHS